MRVSLYKNLKMLQLKWTQFDLCTANWNLNSCKRKKRIKTMLYSLNCEFKSVRRIFYSWLKISNWKNSRFWMNFSKENENYRDRWTMRDKVRREPTRLRRWETDNLQRYSRGLKSASRSTLNWACKCSNVRGRETTLYLNMIQSVKMRYWRRHNWRRRKIQLNCKELWMMNYRETSRNLATLLEISKTN